MGIDTLQDVRDVCIIAFTIAGTILFLTAVVVTVVVGLAATATFRAARKLIDEGIKPTVGNVRGTVAFISDTAVSPIIRFYGLFSGARRGLRVLSGLAQRGEGGKGRKEGQKK
jgi:energy-converting hydrogenase Eha subunit B